MEERKMNIETLAEVAEWVTRNKPTGNTRAVLDHMLGCLGAEVLASSMPTFERPEMTEATPATPTIGGRGKIEAGAVVYNVGSTEMWTVLAMLPRRWAVIAVHNIHELVCTTLLTHVKSAEIKPGCMVQHADGREGFISRLKRSASQIDPPRIEWSNGYSIWLRDVHPDDLTILRQPEDK